MALHASYINTILFTLLLWTTCYATNSIYLQDLCYQDYVVHKDVKIQLMHDNTRYKDLDCYLNLKVNTGTRLRARFASYDRGDDCDRSAIFLNSYFNPNGYCKFSTPSDNYDLGPYGTYRYRVSTSSSLFGYVTVTKAELLVTEVTDKTGDSCPSGLFDCQKDNACIDNDLTCNGYDNCGNNRDEIEGCGLTTGIIVGIVFGVIGFIAIVTIIVLLIIKFR